MMPTTIRELLAAQAIAHGNHEALAVADGRSLSYTGLENTVDRLVASLQGRGMSHAARVAVVLPNGIDVALGMLASCSVATALPLAPQAQADEYRLWFTAGRVTHLLTSTATAPAASNVATAMGLPVLMLESESTGWYLQGSTVSGPHPSAPQQPVADDVAVVLMTSGSTGTPKRVPLTHRNLLAGARNVADSLNLTPADRVLVMWEQYHVGGLVDLLLAPLVSGGTTIVAGSFDAVRFFSIAPHSNPTWFQGVPTTLRELLVHGRLTGQFPMRTPLRFMRSVAAPLPPSLMHDLEAAFGVPVIQTFGMTEAAPLITTNRLPPGIRKPGSCGTPAGCDVAILDTAGNPLPQGTTGEVAARGPNVFEGYEDDPETNARVFRRGWFLTGDIGRLDASGHLSLTGRVKEMINRGGEKIAPAEVEEVAARHPSVAQAAAFAIPHATLGEDVGLAIVPRDDAVIDPDVIRRHVAAQLSRFKVPAIVLVLDELPRCPIGKLRRRDLAELAASQRSTSAALVTDAASSIEDPLTTALASLWAIHLDIPVVGPDEDFSLLGGDSLSRLRLALAVESLCGVTLPETTTATITTVRTMATTIRNLGGHPPPATTTTASEPVDIWGDRTAGIIDDPASTIRRHLVESRSAQDVEATVETLLSTLTLDELAAIAEKPFASTLMIWMARTAPSLTKFDGPTPDEIPQGLARLVQHTLRVHGRLEVPLRLAAWRDEIRSALTAQPSRTHWTRRKLGPTAFLYRRETDVAASRRLVIGFAGNHQRLMLPIHEILEHLPPGDDLLLLSDPDRNHFANGVCGIAATFPDLCDWLARRSDEEGHLSAVTFGTSAGGLASVCAAFALNCPQGVAIGADVPAAHPTLETFLRQRVAATRVSDAPTVVLAYDPSNTRDRIGGEAIAALVPNARTMLRNGSGGHNILRPELTAGRLAELLHELLEVGTQTARAAA